MPLFLTWDTRGCRGNLDVTARNYTGSQWLCGRISSGIPPLSIPPCASQASVLLIASVDMIGDVREKSYGDPTNADIMAAPQNTSMLGVEVFQLADQLPRDQQRQRMQRIGDRADRRHIASSRHIRSAG